MKDGKYLFFFLFMPLLVYTQQLGVSDERKATVDSYNNSFIIDKAISAVRLDNGNLDFGSVVHTRINIAEKLDVADNLEAINKLMNALESEIEQELNCNIQGTGLKKSSFITGTFHTQLYTGISQKYKRFQIDVFIDKKGVLHSLKLTKYDEDIPYHAFSRQNKGIDEPISGAIDGEIITMNVSEKDYCSNGIIDERLLEDIQFRGGSGEFLFFYKDHNANKVLDGWYTTYGDVDLHEYDDQDEYVETLLEIEPDGFINDCDTERADFLHQNVVYYLNSAINWMIETYNSDIGGVQEEPVEILKSNYGNSINGNAFYFDPNTGDALMKIRYDPGYNSFEMSFGYINSVYSYAEDADHIVRTGLACLLSDLHNRSESNNDKDFGVNYIPNRNFEVFKSLTDVLTYLYWLDENALKGIDGDEILYELDYDPSVMRDNRVNLLNNKIYIDDKGNDYFRDQFSATLWDVYEILQSREKYLQLLFSSYLMVTYESGNKEKSHYQREVIKQLIDQLGVMLDQETITKSEYCSIIAGFNYRYEDYDATQLDQGNKFIADSVVNFDYYIKDGVDDFGSEPSNPEILYDSPSISNCPPSDPFCLGDEEPVYEGEGVKNYAYVTIQPTAMNQSSSCIVEDRKVDLYMVNSTEGNVNFNFWSTDGDEIVRTDPCSNFSEEIVVGKKVGSVKVPESQEGAVELMIEWEPFNPSDYTCAELNKGPSDGEELRIYLMAVVTSSQDELEEFSNSNGKSWQFIIDNNNISVKQMTIQNAGTGLNVSKRYTEKDFYFEEGISSRSFYKKGGKEFHVYPNPTKKQITLKLRNSEIESYKIYTLTGELERETKCQRTRSVVANIDELSSGVYLISVVDKEGNTYMNRVVKN